MDKEIIFIGQRTHAYKEAIKLGVQFKKVYPETGSLLEKQLNEEGRSYTSFTLEDKEKILEELRKMSFDILISNGCPIVFPVSEFEKEQLFINVHPTYLPHLKGKTPLNGVFFKGYDFYGATMHFMDDTIDTGPIIYQEKHAITEDLDLGLIYYLSMKLEGAVFKEGWQKLINSNFTYKGNKPQGKGSYFNRTKDKRSLDWVTMDNETLLRRIKSFGISTQGCFAEIEGRDYMIYEAEDIVNPQLLEYSNHIKPGNIFLNYDGKMLVKTLDGLLKIKSFRPL